MRMFTSRPGTQKYQIKTHSQAYHRPYRICAMTGTPSPPDIGPPENAIPSSSELPADIKDLLESSSFERSGALRKLLLYLWHNRSGTLSEYAVATEALGRRADFDPKIDATVRVQVSRLRQKLKEFYEGEGENFPLLLRIPMGSHVLEVSPRLTEAVGMASDNLAEPPDAMPRQTFYLSLLGAACLLLLAMCLWLLKKQQGLPGQNVVTNTSAREFWRKILDGPQRTRIVLAAPDFFFFGSDNTRIRDLRVNDFSAWDSSAVLKKLSAESGKTPHLDQSYTVRADTFASIGLARYLDGIGLGQKVDFVDSIDAPVHALGQANQVVFGTYTTLYSYKSYLDRMNFVIGPHENFVINRQPAPGELKSYDKTWENGDELRTIQPGIIALLPSLEGNTHLLILQARYSSSLVTFLTSSAGVDQLEKMRRAHGSPPYYEAVVFAEMDADRVIRVWPVALHPALTSTK